MCMEESSDVTAKKMAEVLSAVAEKNPKIEVWAYNEWEERCWVTGMYLHKDKDQELPDLLIAVSSDEDEEYCPTEHDSQNLLEMDDIRNAKEEDLFPSDPLNQKRRQFEDWKKEHGFTNTPEFENIFKSENPFIALAKYFSKNTTKG